LYIYVSILSGQFSQFGAPCKLGSYLNENIILKGQILCVLCEIWFPIFAFVVLFPTCIFYSLCCNLIVSKEIHKVVKYLSVGNKDFNMVSELAL
jgi:hypothetical protein